MKRLILVAAGAACLVLPACSTDATAPQTPASSAADLPTTPMRDHGDDSSETSAPQAEFAVSTRTESGSTDDGGSWTITVPQVTGGDDDVADDFNDKMDDAADDLAEYAKDDGATVTDTSVGTDLTSRATITDTAISGAIIVMRSAQGTPHPTTEVRTVVVERDGGDEVDLGDLFDDSDSARQKLVELAAAAADTGRLARTTVDPDSLDEWTATSEGLRLYVPVSHATGDVVVVDIPQSDVAELFDDTGRALFS